MANADDVVDDVPDGADIGALADTLVDRGRAVLDQFPAVADSARDVLAGALMDNGGRANSTRRGPIDGNARSPIGEPRGARARGRRTVGGGRTHARGSSGSRGPARLTPYPSC